MRKRWLSISLVALLVLSLILPYASFAEGTSGQKQFVSQLGHVEYVFNQSAIANIEFSKERTSNHTDSDRQTFERTSDLQFESFDGSSVLQRSSFQPQNFVPVSDSDELISVIVELSQEPIAVAEAKAKNNLMKVSINQASIVQVEQAQFSAALSKSFSKAKVVQSYKHIFNGFEILIPANRVDQLLALPGVKAIYPNDEVFATEFDADQVRIQMAASAPHVGADYLWDLGITGDGIKVGVIDTGIDYLHPDLADAYKGGWDFVSNDDDPYETTPEDWMNDPTNPPEFDSQGRSYYTDHGTHVSGTIAGRGVAANGVKGIAPGAHIYAYRVLGPYGSGSTANVIAAIERSVVDQMDVINLSLGSSSNNQYSATSVAVNNAMFAGVVVVVSAGNTGPNSATATDPGAAEMVITVGNSLPPLTVPSISADGIGQLEGNSMEYSPELGDLAGQSFEVVYVGLGQVSDFDGVDVAGKIALIQRGSISFGEKSVNAKNAGAIAAIIFNNAPGNFNGTLGAPGEYIPTFSLSQEDGQKLVNKFNAEGPYLGTLGYMIVQDFMNDSSSRGPALPGYDIKPDVAAPGTQIRSSIPAYGGDYTDAYAPFTGTSMAAPHVAGAAALLLELREGITQFDVKSLLMNNAAITYDRNGNRYSHMDIGAGRIDLEASANAKAVVLVEESTTAVSGNSETTYQTGSLSFGFVDAGATVSRTLKVKDIADDERAFGVEVDWYGAEPGEASTSQDVIYLEPGSTVNFTFTLETDPQAAQGYYEGTLNLTDLTDGHVLHVPISIYLGEAPTVDEVSDMEITPNIFSPNEDGVQDTADIQFKVNVPNDYFSLDVHLDDGDWDGTILEAFNGLSPGSYILRNWDGYYAWWLGGFLVLPYEGLNFIVPWIEVDGDLHPVESAAIPFISDTEAPESILNEPDIVVDQSAGIGTISGRITDDILIDLIEEGILLNPMSEVFGVGVLYEDGGQLAQVDGIVDDEGNFTIEVPLMDGDNYFEVYVYDAAGNGVIEPAHIVEVYYEAPEDPVVVSAVLSAEQVKVGDAFTVSIAFDEVDDLYAAQISLTYDAGLLKGTVETSAELSAYQQSKNQGVDMIVNENVVDLGNGKLRSDYILTLVGDFEGYNGEGSLAIFNFSSDAIGSYSFELSNVLLLNSQGEEIEHLTQNGMITVVANPGLPDQGDAYVVLGTITAEAFADDFDYSQVFFEEEGKQLKVVVEALNGSGQVVKMGTVEADGSYRLSLPEGEYTIRVVVPGHISATAVVSGENKELHFGPLTAGDVNGDGVVDLKDLQQAAKNFGKTSSEFTFQSAQADINRDGEVDMLDISFILNNFGKSN